MKNRSARSLRISQILGVVTMVGLVAAIAVLAAPRPALTAHCHGGGTYVAPAYVGPQVYGPAGVRGQSRRVSRRTSRRVSRRR